MSSILNLSMDQAMAAFGGSAEPVKAYKFYNGEVEVFYDDAEHSYTRYDETGLVRIPGVSSAVHIIEKPALMPWVAKMTVGYLRDNFDLTRQYTAEEFEGLLDSAKRAHKEYVQAAADTGHLAHEAIEQWIKIQLGLRTAPVELPKDPRALNGYHAALSWIDKHKVRFICTERKIYSRRHDVAGTLDGLAYVTSCDDVWCCGKWDVLTAERVLIDVQDELSTVDWKSSNGLWPEFAYQTALYTMAQNEELGLGIKHRFVNRLGKVDESFESWYIGPERLETDTKIGLACVELYRAVELRKAMDKDEATLARAYKDADKARVRAEKEQAKQAEKEAKLVARLEAKHSKEREKAEAKLAKAHDKEQARLAKLAAKDKKAA